MAKLNIGDEFQVEYGDKSIKTINITNKQQVPEKESGSILFSKDASIESQLNLITCGGNFDKASGQYIDRVIVTSKLKN